MGLAAESLGLHALQKMDPREVFGVRVDHVSMD